MSYKKGVVWWKDERVAEWKDGAMELKGEAVAFEETFKALMKLRESIASTQGARIMEDATGGGRGRLREAGGDFPHCLVRAPIGMGDQFSLQ